MKAKIILSVFILSFLLSDSLFSQTTTISNFTSIDGKYLGWDAGTAFDLNINHKNNKNMIFSTSNTPRMGLTGSGDFLFNTLTPFTGTLVSIKDIFSGVSDGRALQAEATGVGARGGDFNVTTGSTKVALIGRAVDANATNNYGVYGKACPGDGRSFAMFGIIKQGCNINNNSWAVYVDGNAYTPGGAWTASDETLKENIVSLDNGQDLIDQINPKSYYFDQSIEGINLPEGLKYGVLSQELVEVIPHAVTSIHHPSKFDEEGNIESEGFDFMATNYSQLLPVLVSAFKQRQATLDAQAAEIAQLESAIEAAENLLELTLSE